MIASKVKNPSDWMLAVREIVEIIGAAPESYIVLADTLELTCYATLQRLEKRSFASKIDDAFTVWNESH